MEFNPIGVIHSPYKERGDAPSQGRLSQNEISIEVFDSYVEGLQQIELLSHLIILYGGDKADRIILRSKTVFSDSEIGVFASRSPNRPNPIAFCVADLVRRDGNILIVKGVDALDGSPLLDIKAYSPSIDSFPNAVSWKSINGVDRSHKGI